MLSVEQINLLQGQNGGLKKQNAELQRENAELKAENERLKNALAIWENATQKQTALKVVEVDKYKQTLQKIKGIVSKIINGYLSFDEYYQLRQILDLITKAEEE